MTVKEGTNPVKGLMGKTAFITGGASGIGYGMAQAFARAGMNIMIADVEQAALDKAVADLSKSANVQVSGVRCDVSLRDAMFEAAQTTFDQFGKVHVVCSNAGIGAGGRMDQATAADWDWVVGVNQMAIVYAVQAFLPHIKEHGEGGHFVTTASMAGMIAAPMVGGPYTATKFAAVGISEVLREELAGTNISASVLCPGFVNTNIGNAQRNRPDRFGGAPDPSKMTEQEKAGQEMVNSFLKGGLDPRIVGELVLEAVKNDWPYIFTDPNMRGVVEKRFAGIMKGFDQAANSEALSAVKA
ncbi:MAG: SDR family NAD(P)-dependent oxidoreductase [Alphaproteobacteria bacterium]